MITSIYRTHSCGQLSKLDKGKSVKLSGWVHNKRNHGGVLFIDLRDNYGIAQLVIDENLCKLKPSDYEKIHFESVISIEGRVVNRADDKINKDLKTGEIEVILDKIEVISESLIVPFQINSDDNVGEDTRLKYRFLDLRREKNHENIILRSKVIKYIRDEMYEMGFNEFQTPILTASSPEGARDFLVPSRLNPGKFYALPQAPQQFKQLLMISGFDRYFQIAPCFRDEDARADRTPGEFYQLDVEMSFVEQDDVLNPMEELTKKVFSKFSDKKIPSGDFPRIKYKDAMLKYGTDKPDLRNPIEIFDATEIFKNSKFGVFAKAVENNEVIRAIPIKNHQQSTEFFKTEMQNFAKKNGAEFGIAYIQFEDDDVKTCPIKNAHYIDKEKTNLDTDAWNSFFSKVKNESKLQDGDALFFVCGKENFANKLSGLIRNHLGTRLNLIKDDEFKFCWIVDFPYFELNEDTKNIEFSHNPFSKPKCTLEELCLADVNSFVKINKNKNGKWDVFFDYKKDYIISNGKDTAYLYLSLIEESVSFREFIKNKNLEGFNYENYELVKEYFSALSKCDIGEVKPEDFTKFEGSAIKNRTKDVAEKIQKAVYEILTKDLEKLDLLKLEANQYDLVCNGYECLSGAIRNSNIEMMYKSFEIAGYTKEEVDEKFGGMINAFKYGVPPHGGCAFGIERLLMLLSGTSNIRDVIAFPMNGSGQDLMMNAPSEVSQKQLKDLGIKLEEQ